MGRPTGPPALMLALVAACLLSWTVHAAMPASRFDGRPQFKEGLSLGYFTWRDGDTWSVRWTTRGIEARFSGSVLLVGGELTSFTRIDVEEERRIMRPGRTARLLRRPRGRVRTAPGSGPVAAERDGDRVSQANDHEIRFDVRTDDDIDGFDFTAGAGTDRIRFHLEIDGRTRAGDIGIGIRGIHPDGDPLVANLR